MQEIENSEELQNDIHREVLRIGKFMKQVKSEAETKGPARYGRGDSHEKQ